MPDDVTPPIITDDSSIIDAFNTDMEDVVAAGSLAGSGAESAYGADYFTNQNTIYQSEEWVAEQTKFGKMGGIIKPPQSPQTYIGNQVLINSDRLIFNAKKDNLLLFSDKSMGFSTNNSFHFDSDPFRGAFIVNAPHIYLGLELNKSLPYSPAVKGPVLYEILHDLMLIIKNMMGIIQYGLSYNVNLNTGHTAFTTAETSDAFKDIIEVLYTLELRLPDMFSKKVRVA